MQFMHVMKLENLFPKFRSSSNKNFCAKENFWGHMGSDNAREKSLHEAWCTVSLMFIEEFLK